MRRLGEGRNVIDLKNGDCLDLMQDIPDRSIDMIMSDPPYGTTQCKWDSIIPLDLMWEQLKRIIKPNGVVALMAAQPFTTKLISSNFEMFKYCWIWEKSKSTGFLNAWRRPLTNTEDVCIFYKKNNLYKPILRDKEEKNIRIRSIETERGSECYGKFDSKIRKCPINKSMPKTIIKFNNVQRGLHPTQKPVDLMEYLIKTYTNEGDTVLDFCMGSGTTGVAAQNLSRSFIGIEKDEKYFNIASERINFTLK